jgi:hypothetical protein
MEWLCGPNVIAVEGDVFQAERRAKVKTSAGDPESISILFGLVAQLAFCASLLNF